MIEAERTTTKTQFCTIATPESPLLLEEGARFDNAVLAYETYGTLNADRSNAILVFHALSGSQHAAGYDPVGPGTKLWNEECHVGWWDEFVGPGKALDTRRYFVVCANFLGGCYGSPGPACIATATGRPWGYDFPFPTISDIVDSHIRLLKALGIEKLLAVIGGSLGGMCALNLAVRFPSMVRVTIPIATGLRATELTRMHNFEQVLAIETDPNFRRGDYYDGARPDMGLALARMIAHKTYVSLNLMETRARREIVQPDDVLSCYQLRHRMESYMFHQGRKFVERFDANTYLRILAFWQSCDIVEQFGGGSAARALAPCRGQKWLVMSINSDVCFYCNEQHEIVEALKANRVEHQYLTVHSDKGHDSFLLEPDLYSPQIAFMLEQSTPG